MSRFVLFFFLFSLVCFVIAGYGYYLKNIPLSDGELYVSVSVTNDTGGFDVNSTALTFGKISLGGSSMRSVKVYNPYPFPVRAESSFSGSINDLVISPSSSFVILPNQTQSISFAISSNHTSSLGEYNGSLKISLFLEGSP
jgi:hypothetical protein